MAFGFISPLNLFSWLCLPLMLVVTVPIPHPPAPFPFAPFPNHGSWLRQPLESSHVSLTPLAFPLGLPGALQGMPPRRSRAAWQRSTGEGLEAFRGRQCGV